MLPLYELESLAKTEYKREFEEYKIEQKIAKASREKNERQLAKLPDSNITGKRAYAKLLLDEEEAPPPIRHRYVVNDATVEKLGELLSENPNGLLHYRDELSGFLCMLDKPGNDMARAFILECWAGKLSHSYDRIIRGTIDIENALLSVLGGIQPGPLMSYMRTAPDDGLMQRFQLLVWPETPGKWRNVDRYPDTAAKKKAYGIFKRLNKLVLDVIGANRDGEKAPYLRFTDEAQACFNAWREEFEPLLRSDELPTVLEKHLSKYRSLVPTLALLTHLADDGQGPVTLPALKKALAWAEYLESHAWRIYAPAYSADGICARALAKHMLRDRDFSKRFTQREIYRKHWKSLIDTENVLRAVELLTDLDWLQTELEKTGGRTKVWYTINPRISEVSHEI